MTADYDPLTLPAAYFEGLPTGVRHNLPSQPEPQPAPPPRLELPEEQPVLGEDRWREIALYLYAQLDNIDTLYDACKGNTLCFYHNVAKYHPKRHDVAVTDGYRVIFA